MTKVLALTGLKGSGKDWTAELIKEHSWNYYDLEVDLIALAYPVKQVLAELTGLDLGMFYHDKNRVVLCNMHLGKARALSLATSFLPGHDEQWEKCIDSFIDAYSVNAERNYLTLREPLKGKPATIRELMQQFATEWAQNLLSPECWAEVAYNRIEESSADLVIITDMRFPHEYKDIKPDLLIKVNRHEVNTPEHISEDLQWVQEVPHLEFNNTETVVPADAPEYIWHIAEMALSTLDFKKF